MPAWADKLSETDRWNLVNYLRSINGQGPTAAPAAPSAPDAPYAPSATAAAEPDRLALIFPIGFGAFFGGWLLAGLRRRRRGPRPPGMNRGRS